MPTRHQHKIEQMLKNFQLNVTDSRKKILQLFINEQGALAHADIEKKAGEKFDRVTVYRTLQTFVDKGLIHSIPTADNSVRYALCKDECSEGHHHDRHVHFVCEQCAKTACLDHVLVPEIHLPAGYKQEKVEVVISGICIDCA